MSPEFSGNAVLNPFSTAAVPVDPFGKRVSRRGREKRDSEEVRLHNFVYLGGVVHDMRKLWRPYSQSYFWAEPPKIMLGRKPVSTR